MKNTIILLVMNLGLIALMACANSTNSQSLNPENGNPQPTGNANGIITSSTKTSQSLLTTDYENALSIPMQLIIGSLKLEDTPQAMDASAAKKLLPLWQAVETLGSSDTTSSIEMEALYQQIEETMTPEQIAAISAMRLTRMDMAQVVEKLGFSFSASGRFGNLTPEPQATAEARRQSGQGFPGGGFPGGEPFGGGQGGGFNPQLPQTAIAQQGNAPQTNTIFLDAIIKLLKEKAQ